MSLLSEFSATVLQGQQIVGNKISAETTVSTDLIVANNLVVDSILSTDSTLVVENDVQVTNNISANSFLSLHQFNSFPANTADTALVVSNNPNNTYNRGVLAPNNKIYCFPRKSQNVLIIDPEANTTNITSITGLPATDNKWSGGAVAPNGKIYGIPYVANEVLIIDPVTNTADTTTISGLTGVQKWTGGIVYPSDGKIYGMPNYDPSVLIIDPVTNTADRTTITGLSTVGDKYNSEALGPDNKIYGVPLDETRVLIVDPSSPVTNISNLYVINLGTANYVDSSKTLNTPGATLLTKLARGDNIVMTTTSGKYTGYIETLTNTSMVFVYALGVNLVAGTITKLEKTKKADVTSIVGLTGGSGYQLSGYQGKYAGGVLGADNKIYCMARDAASVLIVDPSSPIVDISSFFNLTLASYNNTTKTLNNGSNLTSVLTVGDNILITDKTNPPNYFTGYIQTLTNTQMTFVYALGADILATNIASIQKTRKLDITTIPVVPGTVQWGAGVLAPNGNIYGVPILANSVLKVKTGLPTLPPWMLQAAFNKY